MNGHEHWQNDHKNRYSIALKQTSLKTDSCIDGILINSGRSMVINPICQDTDRE